MLRQTYSAGSFSYCTPLSPLPDSAESLSCLMAMFPSSCPHFGSLVMRPAEHLLQTRLAQVQLHAHPLPDSTTCSPSSSFVFGPPTCEMVGRPCSLYTLRCVLHTSQNKSQPAALEGWRESEIEGEGGASLCPILPAVGQHGAGCGGGAKCRESGGAEGGAGGGAS